MSSSNKQFIHLCISWIFHKNLTHFTVRKLQKKLRDEDGSVVMMSVWMLSFDEWLEWADYSPMLWKYNNGNMNNKPGMFYSDPLQISIVKWLLDNNWTLPVGRERGAVLCPHCPPGAGPCQHLSQDQINSEMRQRRHLQSKAMGQIWNWTEECLWVRVACRRKLPS